MKEKLYPNTEITHSHGPTINHEYKYLNERIDNLSFSLKMTQIAVGSLCVAVILCTLGLWLGVYNALL